jgi:hypothetical protein
MENTLTSIQENELSKDKSLSSPSNTKEGIGISVESVLKLMSHLHYLIAQ